MVKIYELNGGTNKYLASTATVLEKAGVDVFFGDELAMYGDYLAVTSNVQVCVRYFVRYFVRSFVSFVISFVISFVLFYSFAISFRSFLYSFVISLFHFVLFYLFVISFVCIKKKTDKINNKIPTNQVEVFKRGSGNTWTSEATISVVPLLRKDGAYGRALSMYNGRLVVATKVGIFRTRYFVNGIVRRVPLS